MFSAPVFRFHGKKTDPTDSQLDTFAGLLQPGDHLTNTAVVYGTSYATEQVLVTEVSSSDVITVGVILHVVIRKSQLLFIVNLHDAVRSSFGFFQACPNGKLDCVDYKKLADHKPLVKRDNGRCFRFLLHHHLPTPLD